MLPGTLYGAYVHDVRCIRRGTGRLLTLARYALARECAHTYHVLGSFDLLPDTRRVNVWLARDHVRLKERESMTRERKRERASKESGAYIPTRQWTRTTPKLYACTDPYAYTICTPSTSGHSLHSATCTEHSKGIGMI